MAYWLNLEGAIFTMKNNWPKISIVTPVYNASLFIEAAITSVLNQDYPNLEYIIMDGGSTDGTVDIIRKYEGRISYWESGSDRGQTHALNKGFSRSTGILRGWLNADEEYTPGTLKEVGKTFNSSKDLQLIYGDRYLLDLSKKPPEKILKKLAPIAPFPLMFYTGRLLFTDATFWTQDIHQELGELNEKEYPRYAMDVEWLLRMTGIAVKWKYLERPLSIFKYHGMNVTTEGIKMGLRYNENIRRDYAKAHAIHVSRIMLGWLWYSVRLRIWEKGFRGILTPPKWDTIACLFLKKR